MRARQAAALLAISGAKEMLLMAAPLACALKQRTSAHLSEMSLTSCRCSSSVPVNRMIKLQHVSYHDCSMYHISMYHSSMYHTMTAASHIMIMGQERHTDIAHSWSRVQHHHHHVASLTYLFMSLASHHHGIMSLASHT